MFEAPQLDDTGKVLLEAAEQIKRQGWWDGTSIHAHIGLCAASAIAVASNNFTENKSDNPCERSAEYASLLETSFKRLLKHLGLPEHRINIPQWNDRSDAETVMNALREAAYNK